MAPLGYNPYVVITDFVFNTPEPLTFGWMFSDALKAIKAAGYKGTDMFVAAHSLGGVMT